MPPHRYALAHPPSHTGYRRNSRYVPVRDGTRLAVDIPLPGHLPGTESDGAAFPVIVLFTPYYRRFALKPEHEPDAEPSPNTAKFRDAFVPHGYALVVVDIRGCGASFGARQAFRSPVERYDSYDVVDWIAEQGWCDGNIGSTGISYVGAAADFLAASGHPAVKAVIPCSAVWDTWSNHLYPGGLMLRSVAEHYGELATALDRDLRDRVREYPYFADPAYDGPAPVDDDPDGTLLRAAVDEHRHNFDMLDQVRRMPFRDSIFIRDPAMTSAAISPYGYADRNVDGQVACYGISGWMDGGGYSTGTIQRFLWQKNPDRRLLLGPWDHGARTNASPWRANQAPEFDWLGESRRFFDEHLKGLDTGLAREQPVHYFTMGEERWKAAATWPPTGAEPCDFFFARDGALAETPPREEEASDPYDGDFTCGTGSNTRYDRLVARTVETYYADWQDRDARMLTYIGAPLPVDTEVTGHPSATLHIACNEPDTAIFIYLEDVAPDGTCRYVTEGVFRALHRKPGDPPSTVPPTGPSHSFNRADSAALPRNRPVELAFELLPVSYLFRAGQRVRIAIAVADRDHFVMIPRDQPPRLTVYRDRRRPSSVRLPVMRA